MSEEREYFYPHEIWHTQRRPDDFQRYQRRFNQEIAAENFIMWRHDTRLPHRSRGQQSTREFMRANQDCLFNHETYEWIQPNPLTKIYGTGRFYNRRLK